MTDELNLIEVAKATLQSGGTVSKSLLSEMDDFFFADGWWDDMSPFPVGKFSDLEPGQMKIAALSDVGPEARASHSLRKQMGGHGLDLENEPRAVLVYRIASEVPAVGFLIGYSVKA
jgi:hypothetical protein